MSRIGKKEINIPDSVEMILEGNKLKAKGPKGEDLLIVKDGFKIDINDNVLLVIPIPEKQKKDTSAQWGTLRALINNLIILSIPEGLDVKVEKNIITINGISKERVGQFAALIKFKRPVEPYKGKGVRYVGEKVLRKAGKRVASTG